MSVDLSIIIPNYNHAQFFPGVIENCFEDNPLTTEVIVIDDGSTDESLERLRGIQPHFENLRVVALEENAGVPNALNKGIELAKGKWMLFRAADDLFPDDALKFFADTINNFSDCGLVTGDVSFFENNLTHQTVEKTGISDQTKHITYTNYLNDYGGNIIHGTSSFVRREWISELGGFDNHLKWHSDWYVLMEIGLTKGFVYIPETLGAMRLNPQSYNSVGTFDQRKRNEVLKQLIYQLDANSSFKEALLRNGCLDFFGEPLNPAIEEYAKNPASYREAFQEISCDVKKARSLTGLKYVFRQFLEEHCDTIESHEGELVLFGAGGHSQQIIDSMSNLGMRAVDRIVDNLESLNPRFLNGIKIESSKNLANAKSPLVILSSKSYEPLFASIMQKEAPNIPFLRIWGDNDD